MFTHSLILFLPQPYEGLGKSNFQYHFYYQYSNAKVMLFLLFLTWSVYMSECLDSLMNLHIIFLCISKSAMKRIKGNKRPLQEIGNEG